MGEKNSQEIDKEKSVKVKSWSMLILGVFILTILVFLSINKVSAIGETFVCAEKTKSGAWCQNVPKDQAAPGFRQAATSCEATAFCRLGTCVNSQQGECRPNVPQRVCQQSNGVWILGKPDEIPQCQLGCCLVGDQAAFVTQTKCKALSSDYGVPTNYRTDIRTETACIESANPDVKGACVIDDGFERKCKLLTRNECQRLETTSGNGENSTVEFHEGLLCSAETLATNCGMSPRTTCVANKDEVYFLDSCGNLGNIYDSSKVNNQEYWTDIKERDESCNPDGSNAGSANCGSCDYLLGSTCKPFERGNEATPQPRYGDFVCADLSCKFQGKKYQHGEKWCGGTSGINQSLPGSESAVFVCYSGEVTVEQCSAFRQEVCIQDSIDVGSGEDFKAARCTANLWRDCVVQDNKKDCENTDQRDCKWVLGQSLLRNESGAVLVINKDRDKLVSEEDSDNFYFFGPIQITNSSGASCLPRYPPGFDFWLPTEESVGKAEELCAIANENCVVKFERGALGGLTGGDYSCKENCECFGLKNGDKFNDATEKSAQNSPWAKQRNNMCIALGDCGSKKNYIGAQGYHNVTDLIEVTSAEEDDN